MLRGRTLMIRLALKHLSLKARWHIGKSSALGSQGLQFKP